MYSVVDCIRVMIVVVFTARLIVSLIRLKDSCNSLSIVVDVNFNHQRHEAARGAYVV